MRHELFQRRLEVYKALVEYLTAVVRPTPPADQSAVKMIRETADGRFLFKEEIAEYLMDLYKKGIELWALNEELSDPDINSEDRRHKVTERGRLKIWFADQYGVAEGKFKKYLALTLED
ncbi:MAG TPA: hypothetical protein VLX91_02230 [Candidatus Acidoferrales bacterium]|nr:hypothetical protein [Candidatus Acidoferrales bacterium]